MLVLKGKIYYAKNFAQNIQCPNFIDTVHKAQKEYWSLGI